LACVCETPLFSFLTSQRPRTGLLRSALSPPPVPPAHTNSTARMTGSTGFVVSILRLPAQLLPLSPSTLKWNPRARSSGVRLSLFLPTLCVFQSLFYHLLGFASVPISPFVLFFSSFLFFYDGANMPFSFLFYAAMFTWGSESSAVYLLEPGPLSFLSFTPLPLFLIGTRTPPRPFCGLSKRAPHVLFFPVSAWINARFFVRLFPPFHHHFRELSHTT